MVAAEKSVIIPPRPCLLGHKLLLLCHSSPLITALSPVWYPSSQGTVTQLEFGGGHAFREFPRGLEKAFKLHVLALLENKQNPFILTSIKKKKKREHSQE